MKPKNWVEQVESSGGPIVPLGNFWGKIQKTVTMHLSPGKSSTPLGDFRKFPQTRT